MTFWLYNIIIVPNISSIVITDKVLLTLIKMCAFYQILNNTIIVYGTCIL